MAAGDLFVSAKITGQITSDTLMQHETRSVDAILCQLTNTLKSFKSTCTPVISSPSLMTSHTCPTAQWSSVTRTADSHRNIWEMSGECVCEQVFYDFTRDRSTQKLIFVSELTHVHRRATTEEGKLSVCTMICHQTAGGILSRWVMREVSSQRPYMCALQIHYYEEACGLFPVCRPFGPCSAYCVHCKYSKY